MHDRNITIYMQPGSDIWRQEMFKLPYPYPELAEKFFNIPSSDDEFWNITKYQLLEKETYLQCLTYITFPFPWASQNYIIVIIYHNIYREHMLE